MPGLARLNLLVGLNGSGKTALLEALELLITGGGRFYFPLLRRGETFPEDPNSPSQELEYDIRRLFHGREIRRGASLEVAAQEDQSARRVCLEVVRTASARESDVTHGTAEGTGPPEGTVLVVRGAPPVTGGNIALTPRLGWCPGAGSVPQPALPGEEGMLYIILPTGPWSGERVRVLWKNIVLADDKRRVLGALRLLDRDVEEIDFVGAHPSDLRREACGFVVKHAAWWRPVPIGSLGDGIWRVFVLATALVSARGSLLLVDEIGTGLHYSVMADVWRMMLATAEHLDVQVFATTHSLDCINALSEVCADAPAGSISLHRIEPHKREAVTYPGEGAHQVPPGRGQG